jgi:hypothetical protein
VLDAVAFLKANRHRIGELVADHYADGTPLDLSFTSEPWQQVLRSRRKPGRLYRRHLEVCVFSHLAAELRSGDVAVVGSDAYANLYDQLMSWRECQPLVADYCAEAGIPTDPGAFVVQLRGELAAVADRVDAGYPDNADLVIDEGGRPALKRRQGSDRRTSALALEAAVSERIPERGLLDIVARTAYWLGWHRHFGPVSGSDPKLRDALGRYVLVVFCYGANLGPAQLARHMRGRVSPHELSLANKHATAAKLQAASTDVINAFAQLDLPRVWGDGSRVAVDGSQIDTWADNLLAETSIRYGGYGGIAFRHIADSYIALFSRFIPCGVWEAVYILDGLLQNASDVQPSEIHADTQGQSLPVFGLARMLGFDLLPRIRNWQDLIFYRPAPDVRYRHIDALFAPDAVIDWALIEAHWPDLLRTVLSVREGRIQLGDAAAPARQPLPPQPPVPGLPRAGPRGPHDRAAALPVGAQAQGLDRGGDQPDGGLQRLRQVAAVRQRWGAGRQRPRGPGEARQVQRAAGQPGDLPPHRGHHRGGQRACRRGLERRPRRPGHDRPLSAG